MWRRHLACLTLVAAGALTVLAQLPAHADVRTVYVGSFYFSTASGGPGNTAISIENGDQLRFVAQDNGHTVEIPELGISQSLSKGQTFTTKALTKAGTFALYCAPHQNKGHETTLTVRAAAAEPPPPAPEPTSEPAPPPATQPAPAPSKTTSGGSTTTSPASSGSTSGGTATAPRAAASSPTSGSSVDSAPAGSATAATTPAPRTSTSPAAEAAEQSTGLGTAAQDEVAVPAAPGSLEDLIGRPPAADGSWTRSVWMALGLLLPMVGLAGVALARRERLPTMPDAG